MLQWGGGHRRVSNIFDLAVDAAFSLSPDTGKKLQQHLNPAVIQ